MQSSKLNYFKNCKDLNEVKSLYKTLAKSNHPDLGGSTEAMQAINEEYLIACKLIANCSNMNAEEFENEIFNAEAYQNAIQSIINLEGLIIEVVGSWVWVTGNTYPHKAVLKSSAYLFASAKKAWFFRTEENKVKNNKRNNSLDDIKSKYGSTLIAGKSFNRALA